MLKFCPIALALVFATTPQLLRSSLGMLYARQPISFYIEDGKGVPGYRDSDRELAKFALDAWSRESGGSLKFTEAKNHDGAVIRVRWISPTEGLYGETQRIEIGGKPGAIVNVMPQVSSQGEPLASRAVQDVLLRDTIVYLTCVHELGHAVGLAHTSRFDDIMYYFGYGGDILEYFMRYRSKLQSRADIAKHSGLSEGDVGTLRSFYGK
jgi:Matrixin